jgi:response regulator RpfG family c-di-GMP phosphodiesterase
LQGIKQARNTFPDLIVVDSALPDMEGMTLKEILRRLPSTGAIPTLLLKPRPHRLMPLSLQEDGIRAGVLQPLNASEMLRQVADALALCRTLDLEKWDIGRELAREAV